MERKNLYLKTCSAIITLINYMKNTLSDLEVKQFLKEISSFTSAFTEDETISSPLQVSDALAGN